MNRAFPFPMKKYERIIGLLYIPVHMIFLQYLMGWVMGLFGWRTDVATANLIYYAIGALFLLMSMNCYWRATIRDFAGSPIRGIQAIILGYAAYFLADWLVAIIMSGFLESLINPNTAAIMNSMEINSNMMLVVSVLLAPIVEETMFRGALFGTLRKKSRILAYVVSALLFAVYHLWDEALFGSFGVLIYALQYIPAGLALAWCYEWSGSLVAPVVLHAVINLVASIEIIWR